MVAKPDPASAHEAILHVYGADRDPAAGAPGASTEPESYGEHQQDRGQQYRVRGSAEQLDVDASEDAEHQQGDDGKDRLANEKVVTVAEHALGVDGARAIDHDDSKSDESDERGRERDIDRARIHSWRWL